MATTLTGFDFVRRVLRGFSGPQPLGGTAQRAAEAHAAMLASSWIASADGPTIPAHHYDTASPAPGDAYRQTFGYDESTRTERSACGAVCYSIKIPADALTGEACSVSSVSATLVGDRYLECGAIMAAFLSDDATPPAWADILAAPSTAALLAATSAEATVKPNKRADKSATATVSLSAAAKPYLHLVLRVADYTAVRAAWHEGGAMLDPDTISVTFSRDVTPDTPAGTPLDVGLLSSASGSIDAHEAVVRLPLASVWVNWTLLADPEAFASLAASTDEAKVRNLLSYIYNSPDLYDGKDSSVLSGSSARLAKHGVATVMTAGAYGFCALVSHGLAAGRTYTGLALENPINPTGSTPIPYRLLVYAIEPSRVFGSAPPSATPVPWWGDVISRGFREGCSTSLRCLNDAAAAHGAAITDGLQSSVSCSPVVVTPLACLDVTGTLSAIPFSAPYEADELATILLALVPNAAPSLPSISEAYDITVRRTTYGVLANSGPTAAERSGSYTTTGGASVDFELCRAHHINSWPHVPGVTTKDGYYVWASRNNVTWTDYQSFDIQLVGNVTITDSNTPSLSGAYTWFTVHDGKPGAVYYNDNPTRRAAIKWTWTYLGNFQGYDIARLYGHISTLGGIPIRLVKLDDNGEQTNTVISGEITLINLHFWCGGVFVDQSRFPSGHVVAAGDWRRSPPLEASTDGVFVSALKYISAATYSFPGLLAGGIDVAADPATVRVEGSASFEKDGVAYTAELTPQTVEAACRILYRSGGAGYRNDSKPDETYAVQAKYTLPQIEQTLLFSGADGTTLPMTVTLPAREIYTSKFDGRPEELEAYCDPTAMEAYLGKMVRWNVWTDTVEDGAAQSGKGLSRTIDVGLVTLH